MTDDELKALVASLAVAQDRTDEQLEQLRISQNMTNEQMRRTDEKLEQLGINQKITDEQMRKTDEQMRKTDEQMRKTDEQMRRTDEKLEQLRISQNMTNEQMRRTDEKLERMGIYLGNVTRNQGDIAEEFFYNSLVKETRLGSLCFDDIARNMEKHRGNIQEEYDLLMTNGDAIAIVEIKYKAHVKDLNKLERKINNFKRLFPIYQHHKLYGGLASFYVSDDVKKEALERGYFVLQRRGDLIHTECDASQLKVL